jgi:hypothetical protein
VVIPGHSGRAGCGLWRRLPGPSVFFWEAHSLTWRCSYDDALKPVDSLISNNGPYAIRRGVLAAVSVHEASHAVAGVSMGERLETIEVALDFEGAYGGA